MRTTTLLLATFLLLPAVVHADDGRSCKASEPRDLQLDFSGIDTVVFEIGGNALDVRASAGADGKIVGRACASDAIYLPRLTLTQERTGDKLVVRAGNEGLRNGIFQNAKQVSNHVFGKHSAHMTLRASVPDTVMVQLVVGSGDARLDGARAASADVGSGDATVARIRGEFTAKVGSGDLEARDIGSLRILSIGSGDATVRQVRGASKVGSVGSGDLAIRQTQGPVDIDSIGSGDAELADIGGDVTVGSIGSGDLDATTVRGNLRVRSVGSGDIGHRGVTGRVELPSKR
jgi:hypothetical protein